MNDSNHHFRDGAALLCLLLFCGANYATAGAPPVVSNVRAAQRAGTQLVDIYYDLADPGSASLAITVLVSTNGGASYTLPATSFSGSGWGNAVAPGSNKQITWNAGADWSGQYSANVRFRVTADDAAAPSGMTLIPAGSFTMGNCMSPSEGDSYELPLHTVYVSAFYMDTNLVSYMLWQQVYQWATNHGYSFDDAGSGKAANHPVQTIDWYDCVKWCNARSEMAGLPPAYFTSAALAVVYRSGDLDISNSCVNWSSGYRLPTEAEWEKAARGGAGGQRFPWGNTISESQANYYGNTGLEQNLWVNPCRRWRPGGRRKDEFFALTMACKSIQERQTPGPGLARNRVGCITAIHARSGAQVALLQSLTPRTAHKVAQPPTAKRLVFGLFNRFLALD